MSSISNLYTGALPVLAGVGSNVITPLGTTLSTATAGRGVIKVISDISKSGKMTAQTSVTAFGTTSSASKTGHSLLSQVASPSTAHFHAMNVLGPAGAITALAADTVTLGLRSEKAVELRKELAKLPAESQMVWKRQFLEAQSKHADGMVKSSVLGVAADSVAVTGSFIPVVGGIPAAVIGTAVSLIRLVAENSLDSDLLEKLEKIADDYKGSHSEIIQYHTAFQELHPTLKSHYEQVVLDKEAAGKAFLEATKEYEKVLGTPEAAEAHRKLSEAGTALNRAEVAVQDLSKHLEDYERCKENFDAYAQALLLIRDLEPKETPIEERETDSRVSSLLSTFGGTESIEFAPTSTFPSEHVSKSSTKAEKLLREIGIDPETATQPKETVKPAPVKQQSEEEPIDLIEFSEFATTGKFSF